jgi:hypothetical protein
MVGNKLGFGVEGTEGQRLFPSFKEYLLLVPWLR